MQQESRVGDRLHRAGGEDVVAFAPDDHVVAYGGVATKREKEKELILSG